MKALVTGGAGFIGSKLVDFLITEGHDVTVIDDCSKQSRDEHLWNDKANNVVADIRRLDEIQYLFHGVDCVFHMAALTSIQDSINNPIWTTEVNVMGTCNVLECSRRALVGRVVFSSTSAVYSSKATSISETDPVECLNAYATSKFCGEELMKTYYRMYGMETIVLRYFNVFGPGQSCELRAGNGDFVSNSKTEYPSQLLVTVHKREISSMSTMSWPPTTRLQLAIEDALETSSTSARVARIRSLISLVQ